jgi:hypothetical protein
MLVVEGTTIGGSERIRTGSLNQTTCVAPGVEKRTAHGHNDGAELNHRECAVRGKRWREIRPTSPFVTGKFLNICPAFRRK